MVITIIIEGGVLDNPNVAAQTMDNVNALRQEFHRILQSLYDGKDEIDIRIVPQAGYRNAIKRFAGRNDVFGLFVDLDTPRANIPTWFSNIENPSNGDPIIIPQERKQDVFFMIQEMEAWILKQPQAIYSWAQAQGLSEKRPAEQLENHTMLRGKDIEDIAEPADKLKKLITIFFDKQVPDIKDGKVSGIKRVKARYTKLKEGAELLAQLDVPMLVASDSELQRFKDKLNTISQIDS